MKITMSDVRACKMCSKGARVFFERHNLSWRDFLRNGIDSEVVESTGDAMALRVAEYVRRK